MTVLVQEDDLTDSRVIDLLQAHLQHAAEHTPAGSGHALDLDGLKRPEMTFWTAWDGEQILGCIALMELDSEHGEIKSMHTKKAHRGRGVAKKLMQHLIDQAKARGYQRLSLETGRSEGFVPSQKLYQGFGFGVCDPFGPYTHDPFSLCMTRII